MEQSVVTICQKLIQHKSLSGEEQAVAQYIASLMRSLAFDEITIDTLGNVIGILKGKKEGKTLVLDGHIDTVDVGDPKTWLFDPYEGKIFNNRIYGRGASDMKGGIAAMLYAAATFAHDTKKEFCGTIIVSCTVHEESFEGVACREITRLYKPDYVIIGEATSGTIKIGQRGRGEIVLETYGVSCHSSNPSEGINALYLMIEAINRIRLLKEPEDELLGKGILELLDIISSPYPAQSVLPSTCIATFDRRVLVGENEEDILAPIEKVLQSCSEEIEGFKGRVSIAHGEALCWTGAPISSKRFFPAWKIKPSEQLFEAACSGLRKEGIAPRISHFSFCTNGSHYCGECNIPTIGFGPSDEKLAHIVDEYVEIEQLKRAVRGYRGILSELLGATCS